MEADPVNGSFLPLVWLGALYWLAKLYQGPVCVQCGARAKHRADCPTRRNDGA